MIFSYAVASTPVPLFSLSFIFICLYFPLNNLPHLWLLSSFSGPFLLTSAWSTFLPWAGLPFKMGIYLVIYLPSPCEIPLPLFHLEVQSPTPYFPWCVPRSLAVSTCGSPAPFSCPPHPLVQLPTPPACNQLWAVLSVSSCFPLLSSKGKGTVPKMTSSIVLFFFLDLLFPWSGGCGHSHSFSTLIYRHWYYRVLLFPINRKTLLCNVQPAQSPWSLFLRTGEYHSLWNYPKTPVFSVVYITHFWVNCIC